MEIKFKQITLNKEEDFYLIEGWDNNEEIKYHIRPNFNEGEIPFITAKEIKDAFKSDNNKKSYMIICDGKKVGYISIDRNFSHLYNNTHEETSWIGICIGEKAYRGKGIGEVAMTYLEKVSKKLKAKRIELGVFSYNEKAIKLYKKMGYKVIGEVDNFVYYEGRWHKDIRMEKYI